MSRMIRHLTCLLVLLVGSLVRSQNTPTGNSGHQNNQDRLRCLGVQCPPDRPRCITQNQVSKCVPLEPIRTVSLRGLGRNSRLSRPALGFGSSFRHPSASSPSFQFSEAEKSRRNLTEIPSSPSLKPISNAPANSLDNVPSFCFDRFVPGRCRAYFPRYYFNKVTGRCHRFVYGGCGGNGNNFKTEQACKTVCLQPIVNSDAGSQASHPVPAGSGNAQNIPEGSTNTVVNNRPPHGNPGFAKGVPPPQPSHCQQNPERGPCFAMMPRYYYNKEVGQCRNFLYGGCGGNRNNFQSMASCKRSCDYIDFYVSRQSNGKNIPQGLEADILPADIPDASLNIVTTPTPPQTPTIAPSAASSNNRPSQGSSGFAKGAPPPLPQYCFQTPERGPCFALMPRYYYNKEVGQCRSFNYGGCGGNRNNFQTMDACKRACNYIEQYTSRQSNGNNISQGPEADIILSTDTPEISFIPVAAVTQTPTTTDNPAPDFCLLSKKVGPCRALIPRFFYNFETKRCEQFGFGGCQANKNNFKSERECKRECIPPKFVGIKQTTGERNIINTNNERNTLRRGQLRQFNPVDSTAFREFLMNQQMNNDIDIIGPSAPGFYVCTQPMDPGTCNLKVRKYYFNARTKTCRLFRFRGCGGNQNHFSTLRSCQDMCMNNSPSSVRTP